MDELVVRKISPEQLEAKQFNGLSFEQFKILSDDEVGNIQDEFGMELKVLSDAVPEYQETERLLADENASESDFAELDSRESSPEKKRFLNRVIEGGTLSQFIDLRRDGLPDRDMSSTEVLEQIKDYLAVLKKLNPDYEEDILAQVNELDHKYLDTLKLLFQLWHIRCVEPTARPYVDEVDFDDMHFKEDDVKDLEQKGIIENVAQSRIGGKIFTLTKPYADLWLLTYFNKDKEG